MSVPLWAFELADEFWCGVGEPVPWPRDLSGVVSLALPVCIKTLPDLSVARVADWLHDAGSPCRLEAPDQPLRGCLVAHGDTGFVFVDADDPPDERRFTLAHEAAHFLRDYRQPRRRAVRVLGPGILEVLDGVRPPTPSERLHGILRGMSIGVHQHLMARTAREEAGPGVVAAAERDADRLAFELLAPAALLRGVTDAVVLRRRLTTEFGLPAAEAARYADLLAPPERRCGLLERLRRAVRSSGTSEIC